AEQRRRGEFVEYVDRARDNDFVEVLARPIAVDAHAAAGLGLDLAHRDARTDVATGGPDDLLEPTQHRLVATGDVAEMLLLARRMPSREQSLDVRPDEDGRHAPIALPELRQQQGLPDLLVGGAPARPP